MMTDKDVGKPLREIEIEPLRDPFPEPVSPEPAHTPDPAPVREPVPAGA